jgi:hypothetical protein
MMFPESNYRFVGQKRQSRMDAEEEELEKGRFSHAIPLTRTADLARRYIRLYLAGKPIPAVHSNSTSRERIPEH